jgi:formate hydrogenlyase subunit 4
MNARLLGFLFLGVLLALCYHLGIGLVYEHFFPASHFFQLYWYVPLIVVPALLLALLAWSLGFYRCGAERRADLFVTLILAALVALTIPASYSCTLGCF